MAFRTLLAPGLFLVMAATAIAVPAGSPAAKWEPAIKQFEAADKANPPPKDAALFIGSSSILKWTTLAKDFPDTKVINRGFGGSDLSDSTAFVDRIVAPYKPRIIFLYAGDNDLANGKSAELVIEEFKEFVKIVRTYLPKTRIGFISIKPSPSRAALKPKAIAANDGIKAHIATDPTLFYVDVFTPMLDQNGAARPELFGPDMLHMNEKGYAIWKEAVAPLVKKDK